MEEDFSPQPHSLSTMRAMVRLADRLPNIDIVYSGMGIPCDVPPRTIALHQRLLRWKYFKPYRHPLDRFRPHHHGHSVITEPSLCGYVAEMANWEQSLQDSGPVYIREDTEKALCQVISNAEGEFK